MIRVVFLPQLSSCGPIEALTQLTRFAEPAAFRNYQVAAPLKQVRPRLEVWPQGWSFRNYQVAAPLKRAEPTLVSSLWPSLPQLSSCGPIEARLATWPLFRVSTFRNYQVAAPLKLIYVTSFNGAGRCLPQLSSCGPIEAVRDPSAHHQAADLPQLSSCGPIEASALSHGPDVPTRILPQLSSCGPIEAKHWIGSGPSEASFRNYQVAAPLKLCIRCPIASCESGPSATIKLRPH